MRLTDGLECAKHHGLIHFVIGCAIFLGLNAAIAESEWPPEGEEVRLRVTRDTHVSSYRKEANYNMGGSSRLKTKGQQEFSLVDLDPAALKGKVINGAILHLHCVSPEAPQRRLTVSTLASEWVEGTSHRYQEQEGSASFNWAAQDKEPWAWPDSDLTAVMNGMGNTIWRFADCTAPDETGWQKVAVDPKVVAARVAGISHGFVIFDDVGSEYECNGEDFEYHMFPNRYVSSSEAGKEHAPYFTVFVGQSDHSAPGPVTGIQSHSDLLPGGEARVSWVTPEDSGPAGTIGYFVRVSEGRIFRWEDASPVPRYLVPPADKPGERVTMRLRDMDLEPGSTVIVGVRPVDAAGNMGPVTEKSVRLAPQYKPPKVGPAPDTRAAKEDLPSVGGAEVFVVDPLDKVHPVSGRMIPGRSDSYRKGNHLWSADDRTVRLHAARNEFVAFQVVVKGPVRNLDARMKFPGNTADDPRAQLFRFKYVDTENGPLPDPLISLRDKFSIPATDEKLDGQKYSSLLAEVWVPHDADPGLHVGTLELKQGDETLPIRIKLEVWDFMLPDHLSFIPQMNAYGRVPEPEHEMPYYMLSHLHRTCLNILPYYWSGNIADDRAPEWDGEKFNWEEFDKRFGPLLDGSAFRDQPRLEVPMEAFYLPLNENWPLEIEDGFTGGYWVEEAIKPGYWQKFTEVSRRLADHIQDKQWTDTMFEFYLNNKVYHKKDRWSRSSAPWIFDEPMHTQDFWALRWFGLAFLEGVRDYRDEVKMMYRCDTSRPQWQRNLLNGVMDVNVVGGAFHEYERYVRQRKRQWGEIAYNYGSPNEITESNVQPAGWCVDTWCRGLDGVLPWQTLGKAESWQKADTLSMFYPGKPVNRPGPHPSIRLKAFRRGQQDAEYLTILTQATGRTRDGVGQWALDELDLSPSFTQTNSEDAGVTHYSGLDPVDLWRLRTRVGEYLNRIAPPDRRKWKEFKPADRDPSRLPDNLGYVDPAPGGPNRSRPFINQK